MSIPRLFSEFAPTILLETATNIPATWPSRHRCKGSASRALCYLGITLIASILFLNRANR